METVIAIGVLAVLLTGFIAVFTPAAQGIRRSINAQQADRLTTTLERELVTLRDGQLNGTATTGFEKAFNWIDDADKPNNAIFVYQYRGDPTDIRADGTPEPLNSIEGQPGKDYTIQSIARRASEQEFKDDLKAIEGSIFYVKPRQLIYNSSGDRIEIEDLGTIVDPRDGSPVPSASNYNDATIAFSADFFSVPSKSSNYLEGPEFTKRFNNAERTVFSRNLAVRR